MNKIPGLWLLDGPRPLIEKVMPVAAAMVDEVRDYWALPIRLVETVAAPFGMVLDPPDSPVLFPEPDTIEMDALGGLHKRLLETEHSRRFLVDSVLFPWPDPFMLRDDIRDSCWQILHDRNHPDHQKLTQFINWDDYVTAPPRLIIAAGGPAAVSGLHERVRQWGGLILSLNEHKGACLVDGFPIGDKRNWLEVMTPLLGGGGA